MYRPKRSATNAIMTFFCGGANWRSKARVHKYNVIHIPSQCHDTSYSYSHVYIQSQQQQNYYLMIVRNSRNFIQTFISLLIQPRIIIIIIIIHTLTTVVFYDLTWNLPALVMYLIPLNGLYFCCIIHNNNIIIITTIINFYAI